MGPHGNFVVAWEQDDTIDYEYFSIDIAARQFDAAGVPQGAAFLVDFDYYDQRIASVATDADGSFVISYFDASDITPVIQARRYNSAGVQQGTVITVGQASNN